MIRIKVELVPFGLEDMARDIGWMTITNDGTGTPEWGNYIYKINGEEGTYKHFERKLGLQALVRRILNKEVEIHDRTSSTDTNEE